MNPTKFFTAAFLSLIFFFAAHAQTAKVSKCLDYEQQDTTLHGQLLRRTVVNVSKQKETIFLLKLKSPVCVNADAENEFNRKQSGIRDVQLALEPEDYRMARSLINKNIQVSGTLFGNHTQHHFTKVLMTVSEIKKR